MLEVLNQGNSLQGSRIAQKHRYSLCKKIGQSTDFFLEAFFPLLAFFFPFSNPMLESIEDT